MTLRRLNRLIRKAIKDNKKIIIHLCAVKSLLKHFMRRTVMTFKEALAKARGDQYKYDPKTKTHKRIKS